jgi:hypothetical protein
MPDEKYRTGNCNPDMVSCVTIGLFLHAIPAADNRGILPDTGSLNPSLNYSLHHGTVPDTSVGGEYEAAPAPLLIYHFDQDQTVLPGPRYMAYGPSVIALAIDPRLLALLIAICAVITGAWYLLPRNGEENEEEDRSGKENA